MELVNSAGDAPSQIVCAGPIVPGLKLFTVTWIIFVYNVHDLPPCVEVAARLKYVSAVSAGEEYVGFDSPSVVHGALPSGLLSQL